MKCAQRTLTLLGSKLFIEHSCKETWGVRTLTADAVHRRKKAQAFAADLSWLLSSYFGSPPSSLWNLPNRFQGLVRRGARWDTRRIRRLFIARRNAMPAPALAASIQLRPMTAKDVPAAHGLSVALKWPHRLEDWAMMQRLSEGWVVVDDGRVIGSAFACPQGDYATIGLVIVDDAYQGQGLGRKLMDKVLQAAQPRTAILNATLAGAPLYASQGFVEFGFICQHQGNAQQQPLPALPAGESLRVLSASDQTAMLALANAASGLNREAVLSELMAIQEAAVGIEKDGALVGFALLRPFGRGRSIGPVVAQSGLQAQHLISELLASVPDAFVRIDVPAVTGLGPWLESLGLKQVDKVAQMARGVAPQASGGVQQFALVTQAIG
jgi:GNAT superfamily N-acetyltransferase